MVNGTPYVKLADVAKALNMTVSRWGNDYALSAAGGADQVEGLQGKVGDTLFNRQFSLRVLEVVRTKRYVKRYNKPGEVTAQEGNDIVAVIIRRKNGMNKNPVINPFGGENTALTDTDDKAYRSYTGLAMDSAERGFSPLLGSTIEFALVLEVPETAQLKDLVYQIAPVGDASVKTSTFRISLTDQ